MVTWLTLIVVLVAIGFTVLVFGWLALIVIRQGERSRRDEEPKG